MATLTKCYFKKLSKTGKIGKICFVKNLRNIFLYILHFQVDILPGVYILQNTIVVRWGEIAAGKKNEN